MAAELDNPQPHYNSEKNYDYYYRQTGTHTWGYRFLAAWSISAWEQFFHKCGPAMKVETLTSQLVQIDKSIELDVDQPHEFVDGTGLTFFSAERKNSKSWFSHEIVENYEQPKTTDVPTCPKIPFFVKEDCVIQLVTHNSIHPSVCLDELRCWHKPDDLGYWTVLIFTKDLYGTHWYPNPWKLRFKPVANQDSSKHGHLKLECIEYYSDIYTPGVQELMALKSTTYATFEGAGNSYDTLRIPALARTTPELNLVTDSDYHAKTFMTRDLSDEEFREEYLKKALAVRLWHVKDDLRGPAPTHDSLPETRGFVGFKLFQAGTKVDLDALAEWEKP